jgi:predicted permease
VSGELLLLGSLFIRKSNLSKYWYIPIFILVGYFFFVNKIETNEFKKVFSNIVVISFTGYSLLMEIRKNETNKDRFILVDAFIFLYYAVSVFIFFMLKQLKTFSNDEVYMIWSMNNILCSFLYLSIIYTFLKLKK